MSDEQAEGTHSSRYRLRVRFCETDLMGVVHHANFLVYCEAARVDWLHKRGVSYQSWTEHGIHLAVAEAKVRYRKAVTFDDELEVLTTMARLRGATVLFRYRIRCGDQLICEAETLLASVGEDLKLRRIPKEVAGVFERPESVSQQHAEINE